jgi:hypothetical protein
VKNLKKYRSLFHFGIENGSIKDGWIRQLHKSTGGGDKFLLNPEVFGCNSIRELEKFDFNSKLFPKDSDFESNKFKTGLFGGIYDELKKAFLRTNDPDSFSNKNEKLIKRTYETLCTLYNFK